MQPIEVNSCGECRPLPMWTMIAEHGYRYHLATDTFVSLCGMGNLYVRDYVEFLNGDVCRVGESRVILGKIEECFICKKCLSSIKKPAPSTPGSRL